MYRIEWNLTVGNAPCELDLRPNSVVVVRIIGANPAVARYSLQSTTVRDVSLPTSPQTPPSTPPAPAPAGTTSAPPAAVALPQQSAPVKRIAEGDTTHAGIAAMSALDQQRVRNLLPLANARKLITRVDKYFESLPPATGTGLCHNSHVATPGTHDFWMLSQSAAQLYRSLRLAVDDIIPPIVPDKLKARQACVAELLAAPGWSELLTRGVSLAASTFATARMEIGQFQSEAVGLETALGNVTFAGVAPGDLPAVTAERDALSAGVTQVRLLVDRLMRHDLADASLAAVVAALQQSERWVSLISASRSDVTVELTLDGTRGRSRNLAIAWSAAHQDVPVPPGSQTVLVDRFRGVLLSVNGSAGFAGIHQSEILRRALFNDKNQLIADTVQLVSNRNISWGPALSTGLSGTFHWRNGFYTGLGIDLMVLAGAEGKSETRLAFPVVHVGRDNIRLFFGSMIGSTDSFVFPEDGELRFPATAEIPATLILPRKSLWPLNLYIGIVVGQTSIDPVAINK